MNRVNRLAAILALCATITPLHAAGAQVDCVSYARAHGFHVEPHHPVVVGASSMHVLGRYVDVCGRYPSGRAVERRDATEAAEAFMRKGYAACCGYRYYGTERVGQDWEVHYELKKMTPADREMLEETTRELLGEPPPSVRH